MEKRLNWIDQARGLSIFLVVYGHNFPLYEPYIYSFHVPLFFFISGMFHPKLSNKKTIIKRAKVILTPYFFWASALYLFWLIIGRKYGNSSDLNLSILDNFLGIFYAQGGQTYMDWGIPLWFLPCLFLVFLFFSLARRISNTILFYLTCLSLVALGFLWSRFTGVHLPWSIDVAMVSLGFYSTGRLLKNKLISLNRTQSIVGCIFLLAVHIAAFYFNTSKVDMYRALYGNELLFFMSGLAGSIAYILFFKLVPIFSFLSYLGKHTLVILATHIRMLTVIKLVLLAVVGVTVFEFTEIQKVGLSVVQIILIIPIVWLVNKYIPILDGKVSKS